jgi:hypothetical protein
MTKQLLFFMTSQDERLFSEILKSRFSGMVILDGKVWETPEPAVAGSIDQCDSSSRQAYLWNKELFPEIPVGPRPGGKFEGPANGPVLQFLRSIPEGNVLRSGRIALGLNDEKISAAIDAYFREVWTVVKKPATSKLICVNPENGELISPKVGGHWASPDAVAWCRAEKGRFLRGRATQNFYLPA